MIPRRYVARHVFSPDRRHRVKHGPLVLLVLLVVLAGALAGRHLLASLDDANTDVLAVLHANADPLTAAPSPPPIARRMVIVLIDGLGADAFESLVDAGELGTLPDWRGIIDVGVPSLSRPVYHELLTGVPQSVSGVRSNAFAGAARADGLAARVRAAGGSVAWALEGVTWFSDLFGAPVDARLYGARVRDMDAMIELYEAGADLLVWHLIRVDMAGHAHGAASDEYRAEARDAFRAIRTLRDRTIATEPDAARTVWFIGADHGHLASGGHGGPEPAVRETCWIGLWPSHPRDLVILPTDAPATRMAATFARVLGVDPPREALGDALPLPDAAPRSNAFVTRREARVRTAFVRASESARRGVIVRSVVVSIVIALLGWLCGVRFGARSTAAALCVVLAGMLSFALLGPGLTLSAIRTHLSFLTRSVLSIAIGAAIAWGFARGDRRRFALTMSTSALPFIATFAVVAGSVGRSNAEPHVCLLAPTAGLVPTGVLVGIAAIELALRMRRARTGKTAPGFTIQSPERK